MEDLRFFRKQFLLTINDSLDLPWIKKKISFLNLYYHPSLEFNHAANGNSELFLMGFLYDYKNTAYSNKQILDILSYSVSFENFLEQLSEYSGHFVIIYKTEDRFIILNDACGQYPIYYDTTFNAYGTQPKILSMVVPLENHSSSEAAGFYSSAIFLRERVFIGETTHLGNIRHLLPNHYIDINLKSTFRFFPVVPITKVSLDEAAAKACEMLKGYITAASLRNRLYMGISGGYDSRVLFLASIDVDCRYYVSKLSGMNDDHYDIVIPQKLTGIFNKEFRVVVERPIDEFEKQILNICLDFPRELYKPDETYKNHILINGNLSEIARNAFGNSQEILPEELTVLYSYKGSKFVSSEIRKWITNNSELFSKNGYNILDMFYWEERMGNWAAKAKTEMSLLGTDVYSPFCSHKLLNTLLSTPRKHRDHTRSLLYDSIIKKLSPDYAHIPINPSRKKRIILFLQALKIFHLIQKIKLKIILHRTPEW